MLRLGSSQSNETCKLIKLRLQSKYPKLLPSCFAGSIMPDLRITAATQTHPVDSALFAHGQSAIHRNCPFRVSDRFVQVTFIGVEK